jgi:hypothetical protein
MEEKSLERERQVLQHAHQLPFPGGSIECGTRRQAADISREGGGSTAETGPRKGCVDGDVYRRGHLGAPLATIRVIDGALAV